MTDRGSGILAFVVKNLTPYRTHFLEHVAAKMPEVKVVAVVTGGRPNQPWEVLAPVGVVVIEVPRLRPGSFRDPTSVSSAVRVGGDILAVLRAMRPIAVVVHGYDDPAHARVIRGCHRAGIPVVLRGDSNLRGEARKAPVLRLVKRWLLRSGFRYVDAFMPVGTAGSAYFMHYGAREDQIFIVPLEPLYPLFTAEPDDTDLAAFQSSFDLDPSRQRILFVGRLVQVKRVDILIRAFLGIAAIRPEWDLLISGTGPSMDSLQQMVPGAMHNRIRWTGFLAPEDLRMAYASSEVLALPSASEPWGLVVNESITAGLAPVLSDAVGAGVDLVPTPDTGWVFRTNDQNDLEAALLEATKGEAHLLKNRAARERLLVFRASYDSAKQVRRMLAYVSRSSR